MIKKKYFAFISYSHKDSEMAKWLQHEFEHYELPAKLFEERKDLHKEDLPESFRPIFRDEDELSGGELKPQISDALADSEYLIVVCSPNSAQSVYVDSEIKEFISLSQKNKRRIFPFIVDGKPHQDEDHKGNECFPKTLLELSVDKTDPIELIAGDIHATGRDHAFVKILAGTLKEKDIRFADLWDRYAEEKAKKEREEREEKEKLQIVQSRFVAEKAEKLVDEGDSYLARRLLLEVLDPKRPYVVEAESALRKAVLSLSGILSGHTSYTSSAFFSPNGKFILSASNDKSVRIWDAETGQQIGLPLNGHELGVTFASFSPDGKRIVSASEDHVRIWDMETRQCLQTMEGEGQMGWMSTAFFSPDGKRILSAFFDVVCIWDVETGRQIGQPLDGHTLFVTSAAFSPDGKRIVSASRDKTIRIWDAQMGKQIGDPLEGHTSDVASFSPDGKRIVSVSGDSFGNHTICIWDSQTGTQIGDPLEGRADWVTSASFSPDGKCIVLPTWEIVRVWDLETGQQIGEPLKGHTSSVKSAAFSPDGKRIVSASDDNSIRIWDVNTWQQIGLPLEGHTKPVTSANFSSDGKRIVSTSLDQTIRIWDAETGRQIGYSLDGYTFYHRYAFFSHDGRNIVSVSNDGIARIWDYPPLQELIDETRERFKDYPLTDEEKRKYYLG